MNITVNTEPESLNEFLGDVVTVVAEIDGDKSVTSGRFSAFSLVRTGDTVDFVFVFAHCQKNLVVEDIERFSNLTIARL